MVEKNSTYISGFTAVSEGSVLETTWVPLRSEGEDVYTLISRTVS